MDAPDAQGAPEQQQPARMPAPDPPRFGRYVVLLGLLILVLITVNTIVTKPHGASGIAPGEALPAFAVPLASGNLKGDANVSTAGKAPACTVRGPEVLNICQLYERGPVVLALFVDSGSCPDVLGEMQTLSSSFPSVRFAAVAIRGDRGSLRTLIRKRHLTIPVGLDDQGDLAALYRLATCPQVSFALKGGVMQSKALLGTPSLATLRDRVSRLVAASTGAPG
jgi:hypothetical protein